MKQGEHAMKEGHHSNDPNKKDSTMETKIWFLRNEIDEIHRESANYKDYLRLNKEGLRIALTNGTAMTKRPQTKSSGRGELSSKEQTAASSRDTYRMTQCPTIIELLQQEQKKLRENYDQIKADLMAAQRRVLLTEMTSNAKPQRAAQNEKVLRLEKKLQELTAMVEEREAKIQKLEHSIRSNADTSPQREKALIRYIDLIHPNQSTIQPARDVEFTWLNFQKLARTIGLAEVEKAELTKMNTNLMRNLVSMRRELTENPDPILEFVPDEGAIPLDLKLTGKLNDVDLLEESMMIGLEKRATNKLKQEAMKKTAMSKAIPVPKLDLTKALKIQEMTTKKMVPGQKDAAIQEESQKLIKQYQANIAKIEKELVGIRAALSKETDKRSRFQGDIKRLQDENEGLCKMNDTLRQKYTDNANQKRKMLGAVKVVRTVYDTYLQGGPWKTRKGRQCLGRPRRSYSVDHRMLSTHLFTKPARPQKTKSALKASARWSPLNKKEMPKQDQPGGPLTREDCVMYLISMQSQMLHLGENGYDQSMSDNPYLNAPSDRLNTLMKTWFKLKRSKSNPLEYIPSNLRTQLYPSFPVIA